MPEYGLTPFVLMFPSQGMMETRVIRTSDFPGLPDDDYGLQDSYCNDPACHCRRVMLNVASRRQQTILATISYAFDRDDDFAGPFLDPLNPQSVYSEILLHLVTDALDDPAYVERLEAHYYQVKGATADPSFRPSQPPVPNCAGTGSLGASPSVIAEEEAPMSVPLPPEHDGSSTSETPGAPGPPAATGPAGRTGGKPGCGRSSRGARRASPRCSRSWPNSCRPVLAPAGPGRRDREPVADAARSLPRGDRRRARPRSGADDDRAQHARGWRRSVDLEPDRPARAGLGGAARTRHPAVVRRRRVARHAPPLHRP